MATVAGLFDTFNEAQNAVQDLINSGIARDDISVVANDARGETRTMTADESATAEGAGVGAVGGTVLGGTLGLLVGLGALVIPGIGPVLAVGPLAAAIGTTAAAAGAAAAGAGIGAAAGGLLGALVGAGVPEEEAHYYAEGVRRGGTLVTVASSTMSEAALEDIMRRNGAIDLRERGNTWREEGWERFDTNRPYDTTTESRLGDTSVTAGRRGQVAPSATGPVTTAGADTTTTERARARGYDRPGDTGENDWEESSKVGTATGTAAGAATGAAIGSVGGPVGTVIGGVAGAAAGAATGAAGDVAGEKAEDSMDDDDEARRRRERR